MRFGKRWCGKWRFTRIVHAKIAMLQRGIQAATQSAKTRLHGIRARKKKRLKYVTKKKRHFRQMVFLSILKDE